MQMSVLLAFNEADTWNVESLAEATNIKMDILVPVISILLKAKLLVGAKNKVVGEDNMDAGTDLGPFEIEVLRCCRQHLDIAKKDATMDRDQRFTYVLQKVRACVGATYNRT